MITFLTKSLKRAIQKSSIVSFDVFDTLLLRPYIHPTDLFLHMAKYYDEDLFYDSRISAESDARKSTNAPDVTLDEIYNHIKDDFKKFKSKELMWENMVLRANPQMKEVFDFALQNNKKIIIASDMYLPKDFIDNLLHKNGFDGYDKLYVSCEIGATKSNGSMFDLIIKDTKVSPNKILHIGDNKDSDYKKPRKYGIKSVLYSRPTDNYIKHNTRIKNFIDKTNKDIGASVLISMIAYNNLSNKNNNYWHNLGYEYSGPVCYGYTRFIEKQAQEHNVNNLMFIARDGYTLQRVFNTFNNSIYNSYVYAPRFLNLICRLDYDKKEIEHLSAIINFFSKKDAKIKSLCEKHKFNRIEDYNDFIQNNINIFQKLAKKEFDLYNKYLTNNIKTKGNVGIVDTLTLNFSSQKLIENILGYECFGFYWTTKSVLSCFHKHVAFLNRKLNSPFKQTKNWNFMEFLMTAPEFPIKQINQDGTPVYDKNPTKSEQIRKQVYPDISDGALNFANDIKHVFNGKDIYLSGETLITWINCFCDFPTNEDVKYMQKIKHAPDSAHTDYQPLFCTDFTLKNFILHPVKLIKDSKNSRWHTTLEKCITPVIIKNRGIKQIKINIFPFLRRNIFNINIKLTDNWFYQFTIGKGDNK